MIILYQRFTFSHFNSSCVAIYYQALQVFDSLLPKTHDQNKNILDSCCSDTVRSSPELQASCQQYLHSALNTIEVLLQNQSFSQLIFQSSDLLRLATILILTLYMNYARLCKTPDSSDLRSKFVHHLREYLKFQHLICWPFAMPFKRLEIH